MVGKYIIRGLVVGVLAGLLTFGWARTFGERSLEAGIAFEAGGGRHAASAMPNMTDAEHAAMPAVAEEEELFSREIQSGIGLLTGTVVIGIAIGGMFGLAFAVAFGRLGSLGPGATSLLIATAGFLALYLIPALKFPPNPPGANTGETIAIRTALYFLMMAIGVASTMVGMIVQRRLSKALGGWNAAMAGVGVYLAVIVAGFLIIPSFNEVADAFPANMLWEFRWASIGTQLVLWMSIGVLFGVMCENSARRAGRPDVKSKAAAKPGSD